MNIKKDTFYILKSSTVAKHLKTNNIQYNTLGWWDDCLINHASDVPSIIFFHNFLQNSLQKSFQFIYFL